MIITTRFSTVWVSMWVLLFTALSGLPAAYADETPAGLITIASPHSVAQTADRLEQLLKAKKMTVFARLDHAEGAKSVDKVLRPTELIVFGNPKIGTLLMQCNQTAAIDLPQKALIWQDKRGQTWLTYNDPKAMAERHHIADCGPVIGKIGHALANFAAAATAP